MTMGKPMTLEMPVFPLNAVTFPYTPIALHIFEERYRAMVRDIEGGDRRFCVALIMEGEEVGGAAAPHEVACVVEIVHLDPLPDGRYNLLAIGVQRVRIVNLDHQTGPYLRGSIRPFPEEAALVEPALMQKASDLFVEYAGYLMALSDEELGAFTLPADPETLSYVLATALQVGLSDRQRLLEMPNPKARLEAEVSLMRQEMPLLRALASGPKPTPEGYGPFSRN